MGHLTKAQAAALLKRVEPMLTYLGRCKKRLDERGYDHRSAFYRAVNAAYDGVHSLRITLHYESIGRGIGEAPKEE
jgi:hypothetical protein